MSFIHLQIRSGYTLMKSMIQIDALIEHAKIEGWNTVALTDEEVMYGAAYFYRKCKKENIEPIIGMIINVVIEEYSVPVTLLAKDEKGYQNLLALSTLIQGQEEMGCEINELLSRNGGLIALVGVTELWMGMDHSKHALLKLEKIATMFLSEFDRQTCFLAIQDHGKKEERKFNKWLVSENKYPITLIQQAYFLHEEDADSYRALQAIRHGKKWSQTKEEEVWDSHYLKSANEMEELSLEYGNEIIHSTSNIASKCKLEIPLHQAMLPEFPTPSSYTSDEYLSMLCERALSEKYQMVNDEIRERLNYELSVIKEMKFSDYFLIVWDFMKFAHTQRIMTGPGRGSAAGSLVAYLLDITKVDPLKYGLLFERFLNPERISMPDIDIDFSDHRREEVIHYVLNKYGENHVAQIVTFGTFAARSIVRELIKVMGIDQQDSSFVLRELSKSSDGKLTEMVRNSFSLKDYIAKNEEMKHLFRMAIRLEGLPRNTSTHAAGLVISKRPLVHFAPTLPGQNGIPLTQYPMNDLEEIGLLKIDFLGLRNLTLMERIVLSVERQTGRKINLSALPLNDGPTFQLLQLGKTLGIFQLESQGMQKTLRDLKPTHFEDVVAVNALYRPGPMEFIDNYIRRKHHQEKIIYPHEALKPILEKTYGVLVYQEQIMEIAHVFAGLSLGEADLLRRAVSKKDRETMESIKSRFVKGCLQMGYTEAIAFEVFDWIVRFSNYGFNRSHAVAYSMISYQLAYLKAHESKYFYAEVISSFLGDEEKVRHYVQEARRTGVEVLPPSINLSFGKCSVEEENIRMGLALIKGVGYKAVEEIVSKRKKKPFASLYEFCQRISLSKVNRATMENLILAGAFDGLHSNRASLLASLNKAIEQGELFAEFQDQESLFEMDIELEGNYIEVEPYSSLQQLSLEKEVLGFYLSSHPLSSYRQTLQKKGYISFAEATKRVGLNHQKTCAIIHSIKTIRTKRGESMAFLSLSDEWEEIDGVLFPELYRKVNRMISEEMMVIIHGKLEKRRERLQWVIENIYPLIEEEVEKEKVSRLFLKIEEKDRERTLSLLNQLSQEYPGSSPVILHMSESKQTYQLGESYLLELKHGCLKIIKEKLGQENVAVR
ncbi:DNA polymerase III subunit alpha [Bacillaceae bacterium S4-13-58]